MDIKEFEKLVKNDYKIFVDTSSLMQKNSKIVFFKIIAPLLYKYKKRLIIPKSVLNEISKHNYNNHKNINIANHILNKLAKSQLYGINSTFNEEFADNAITAQFHSLRLKYNLCLITNDNSYKKGSNLSQDILDLKKSRSTENIKDIRVFFIKNETILEYKSQNTKKTVKNKPEFTFSLPNKPNNKEKKLKVSNIPKSGDFIIDNKNTKHKLIKQIGRTGGEGSVYLTNTNYICKVYKEEKVTLFRQEKIKLLIKNNIRVKNVCLPELIAYNSHNEFIGYLMPKAEGNEIKTSIFIPPLFKQKFPSWNRIHLAKISLNILKTIKKLHNYNIILGDINPNNILLKDENIIYFIDTDSFQIENYPCSVGMVPYTRAIHHGKRYKDYLRTKDDDIFATATLIFQLMLPGKLPYSFSGGGSEKENMKPQNFPYKCYDGTGYNNAPDGQWVYIWSHLPKKLKLLFCKIFKKNKKVPIDEFIKQINSYIWQLEEGHQTKDIFPLTYKQVDGEGNVLKDDFQEFKCKMCGKNFAIPNQKIKNFKAKGWELPTKCEICRKIKKSNLKQCTNCGKQFHDENHTLCKRCRGDYIICNSCYSTFLFSESEKDFYNKKGLDYPKKCKNCRNIKSYTNGLKFLPSLFGFKI